MQSFVINDKRNYLVTMKRKGKNYCYLFFFGKTRTRISPVKVDNHQTQKILNNPFSVHMEGSERMLAAHSQGPECFPRESDSQRNCFQEVACAHGAADLQLFIQLIQHLKLQQKSVHPQHSAPHLPIFVTVTLFSHYFCEV